MIRPIVVVGAPDGIRVCEPLPVATRVGRGRNLVRLPLDLQGLASGDHGTFPWMGHEVKPGMPGRQHDARREVEGPATQHHRRRTHAGRCIGRLLNICEWAREAPISGFGRVGRRNNVDCTSGNRRPLLRRSVPIRINKLPSTCSIVEVQRIVQGLKCSEPGQQLLAKGIGSFAHGTIEGRWW